MTATPGGPERITAGTIFAKRSIFALSGSRTESRSRISGGSPGGASGPQHAECPMRSVSVSVNSRPSRSQNSLANASALSAASGAERMSVPLAFQPSKYEALTLSAAGAGRPLIPHTRTRSRPAASSRIEPKSATTSGVM